eukprot:jgi/Orpsp1_1/1185709/evm.model.c7180000094910.1
MVDFLKLINNNIIKVKIDETLNIKENTKNLNVLNGEIWYILLFSGYVTITDEKEYINQNNKQNDDQNDDKKKDQKNKDMIILSDRQKLTEQNNINTIENYKNNINNKKNEINNIVCIKIPNQEVLEQFLNINKECMNETLFENETYRNFVKKFINGINEKDIEEINKNLTEYIKVFSPYHLFVKYGVKENVYQVLIIQMFIYFDIKGLKTEENSGNGRYDFGFP